MRTAIYPGTFDPITLGHADVIQKCLKLCDRLIVATTNTKNKNYFFPIDKRIEVIKKSLFSDLKLNKKKIIVIPFNTLTINLCKKYNASIIVRGLRAVSDFEYEFQLAKMNRVLAPEVESMFLTPAEKHSFISSTLVREIASLGGDVSHFVHPLVAEELRRHLSS